MRASHVLALLVLVFAGRAFAVIPISADAVIQPGHYFDLEGKMLNFRPLRGGYSVSSSQVKPVLFASELLGKPDYPSDRSWGYRRQLPFPFRFGGKVWREVFVNGAGNLTFSRPEAELYPERDTWPDGTMQSVGGSINDRAAAGKELMICALWALNAPEEEKTQIYVRQSANEFVITWKTQRYEEFGEGYAPLGQNVFQAQLSPDGSIALSYQAVAEKDGIVGVFPGGHSGRQVRLATTTGYREGNIFEVFHYPHVSKDPYPLLHSIYKQVPPQDDFATIFTDFRIDDLHNHQGTRAPYGYAVKGIGADLMQPEDTFAATGSHRLEAVTGPIFLGPRFGEFLNDGDRHFRNYANAVGWLAHEFGHRWGLELQFWNPVTGKTENLAGADGHWSDYLDTPAMISVWKMFCDKPYVEKSQMEGFVYSEGPPGVFSRETPSWNIASGFSALDLYVMGLIAPNEVPDTFLIAHPELRNEHEVRGEKVPVRIQDIIAASGAREPGVGESQKEFTVGLYLLHEGNRAPYAGKLMQLEGIEKSLIEYYRVATGGRMHLVPAQAVR